MQNNPYQAYKQKSIMTMTPNDMVIALYDALLKNLNFALEAFKTNDYGAINLYLQKAQAILRHFISSLNFDYEISANLEALYEYFLHVTIQANMKKNPDELPAVIENIGELRDSYIKADKQKHSPAAK